MYKQGFSLVELSIVLVILGLLVGGILGGQSLIRAAELRNVPLEYQKFQAAVFTFQQKHHGKPGDFILATRFWGNASTGGSGGECDATEQLTAYTDGKQTCNGNGNGLVDRSEIHRFWQHLSNAGLLEVRYTGISGPGGSEHCVIGKNCPASRVSGAGWSLTHYPHGDDHHWGSPNVRHQIALLGGQSSDRQAYIPLFGADELWSIDQKLDDAKPGTGLIRTRLWRDCTDAANRDAYETAEYALDFSGRCAPYFYRMY